MKTIIVDSERCLQCGDCMIACKDEHCDNDWSPVTAPQRPHQNWIRIDQSEVGSGYLVKVDRVPIMCQHCGDAACMEACSYDAIHRRDDGIVLIDPATCTGCGDCAIACSYGVIFENKDLHIFQKCTMCAHLLDAGWSSPRCVTACPTDALRFVDVAELDSQNLYAPLEKLNPALDDKPLVAYVNTPRPFVGGDVESNMDGSRVQDSMVTVTHQVTGMCWSGATDALGGFKIPRIEPGFYTVSFECSGFETKTIRNVDLRSAVNMGTVGLNPLIERN